MSQEHERRATWTELFYDLVFVVAVSVLGHKLSAHLSLRSALEFAALFIPVWWAWIGATFYADRFDKDDVLHRVMTFFQIVGICGLAIYGHDAFGSGAVGFAWSYVTVRLVLCRLYWRVGQTVVQAKPLVNRYVTGFLIAIALWVASTFLPAPFRYYFWAVAMLIDMATPLTARRLQGQLPLSVSHLPERFGLFTLIVLGELIAGVINGALGHSLSLPGVAMGAISLLIAFAIWWVYFDNIDGAVIRKTLVAGQVWVYSHLVLTMSLVALGAGVRQLVALGTFVVPAPQLYLMAASIAGFILAYSFIRLASR